MLTAVKGMNDVLPQAREPHLDGALWRHMLATCGQILTAHGYQEVWLPVVEDGELFTQGLGAATDVVAKEMYAFEDRGGRLLALRPEGTAGAARAYVQHGYGRSEALQRWWYAGPMFRAERPQKGRYRQFYQVGAEFFGAPAGLADVEMLLMVRRLCAALGVPAVQVRLNTLGDEASRAAYREVLVDFLRGQTALLCEACVAKVEHSPLRVLDCKRPGCRQVVEGAPDILASLSDAARATFAALQETLTRVGFTYTRDPRLVRGLDYYTGLIFELVSDALGAQDAVLGGGRYDRLVASMGGPITPAIGFAAGLERLALLRHALVGADGREGPEIYLAPLVEAAHASALTLAEGLRQRLRARVEVDALGGRAKQQLRRADRAAATLVLVLGEEEMVSGHGRLKALRSGQELEVALTVEAVASAAQGLGALGL